MPPIENISGFAKVNIIYRIDECHSAVMEFSCG